MNIRLSMLKTLIVLRVTSKYETYNIVSKFYVLSKQIKIKNVKNNRKKNICAKYNIKFLQIVN